MANIKSQIKRNRQNEKRRKRNQGGRSSLKTASKKATTAAESGDPESTAAAVREASRSFDKAASKGILHKRAAARHKSRLAKAANRAAASAE